MGALALVRDPPSLGGRSLTVWSAPLGAPAGLSLGSAPTTPADVRARSADLTIPESTTIIEYLDDLAAGGPRLVPADRAAALQARVWDRFFDQHVAVPMQKIVGDRLRPEGRNDPEGVAEARHTLDTAYAVLEGHIAQRTWAAGAAFTVADCAAAPALFYTRAVHRWNQDGQPNITRYYRDLMARGSFARVVDEARPWRGIFPLPWPADMDDLDPARS